ncbi:LytTR family DNA-binding domain-containing protein [Gelidibacter japonicus]|uniref:LytR/AlgR family response regulator transcription factor n=1 Tax=Gelidibacter japonicus TaxID=1962232 RepID=UPI0020211C4E|nr:LytTR family DNA-binding domain-containing protein [Gelidibacter japonicus]MCL8007635.1 LytTR family DNA-binding domain-containing protein [Gelidibacter japonicus]
MIRTIIIDDEQHCIDRVKELMDRHQNMVLIGEFTTVESGIMGLKNLQPDVLFLDVQINEQTGFDVLKAIEAHPFEVIFTTAFDFYAVQAFKFSAIDYLLKPVDADDFNMAIDKVTDKLATKDFSKKVNHLLSNIIKPDIHKKISVPTFEGFEFLEVADIVRCQSDVNYTNIFTKNGQKLLVSKTLKSFEELLTDCNFYRVHNSHLINLEYIKKYTKGKGGYVTLKDDTVIEVSMRRKEGFLMRIN